MGLIGKKASICSGAYRLDSRALEGHVVWWVPMYPVPEWRAYQGRKRGRLSDAPSMSSAYYTSLWGQCYDLGLLQSVRLGSATLCPQRMRYLNILSGQVIPSMDFSSLIAWAYSKMPGFIRLKLWKSGSVSMGHSGEPCTSKLGLV